MIRLRSVLRLSAPRDPLRDPDLWASEGAYLRIVEGRRGRVEIYVLYFSIQLLSFHVWDHEPILVYLDQQGRILGCMYDAFHYNIGWSQEPRLVLAWPWRSLHGGFAERETIVRTLGPIRELTDELIDFWRERIHNPLSIDGCIPRGSLEGSRGVPPQGEGALPGQQRSAA